MMWPFIRWSHDDKYFARSDEDMLSVYETPVSAASSFFLTLPYCLQFGKTFIYAFYTVIWNAEQEKFQDPWNSGL